MNNLLTALYLTVFLTKYLKKRIKRTKKDTFHPFYGVKLEKAKSKCSGGGQAERFVRIITSVTKREVLFSGVRYPDH